MRIVARDVVSVHRDTVARAQPSFGGGDVVPARQDNQFSTGKRSMVALPVGRLRTLVDDILALASVEKAMELAAASGVKDMAPAAEVFMNMPITPTKP